MKLTYNNKSGQLINLTETLVDCSVVDVFFKIQTEKMPNIFIAV